MKTFKNGNNVKGYKSLIKLTKLEQEGFLSKEGGLSLHCTVTNDLPGAAFKMFKFQCSSATEIEVNGFTSQEQGTLYSRWAPLEGLGQWRAFCCPRGLATYRKFVSCGFQVEPSAELQINGTRWMASFTARAEILRLGVKKGVKTEDSNNSGSSSGGSNSDAVETVNTVVEDAVSFTNVRVRASVNEFVPVEAVLKPENQFMSTDGNDTIIIKFNLKPLNASNPNKIVSKKAALAAKERVAASLKKLNESLDTLHKSCVTLDETKVKVLTRFQTLAQNVQKYADAYNTAVVLTERYAQLDEEIRGLEARESALLGRCAPADAQKLLETVTASAALLAQRLASVPEGTVPVKSELPPFGDDGAKISFPSATPPGNKGMCLTFVEAWDRMLVAGYRVSQACIESGIALEEICALNETMREEYSRVAGLANEKKKVVDKMGPYRQSIWDKWARLKKDVNVLEGNVDVINSLTRKEAEKYIGMAEEAQENFKAAAGTK